MRWSCLIASLLPLTALAEANRTPTEDTRSPAGVNWAGLVIQAIASGAPDVKAVNRAQARLGAERAAQMDAVRSLLGQVEKLPITSARTVGDELANAELRAKVESALKGYRITSKRYYSDGGVELDVEMPLSALTALLLPSGDAAVPLRTEGAAKNTGLVVDARGLSVAPALAPRLLDEQGRSLYAAEVLSAEARQSRGVAAWVKSLDEAKRHERVGRKPLVIRAAKASGTDLVISAEDVKRLTDSNNAYLADGRVVIVTR